MTGLEPNEVLPGSSGGVIEAVKRAIVTGLRTALTGTSLSSGAKSAGIHVDMEYPSAETKYPGVWVQFSLRTIRTSGIGMGERLDEKGQYVQSKSITGQVSLTLMAMSSLERDRIADRLIDILAFSRTGAGTTIGEYGPEEQFTPLYAAFDENPYISLTINSDELRPGGQSITVGAPWDETALVYEDNYSFDLQGEFQEVRDADGLYRLRRIDVVDEPVLSPYEWR